MISTWTNECSWEMYLLLVHWYIHSSESPSLRISPVKFCFYICVTDYGWPQKFSSVSESFSFFPSHENFLGLKSIHIISNLIERADGYIFNLFLLCIYYRYELWLIRPLVLRICRFLQIILTISFMHIKIDQN